MWDGWAWEIPIPKESVGSSRRSRQVEVSSGRSESSRDPFFPCFQERRASIFSRGKEEVLCRVCHWCYNVVILHQQGCAGSLEGGFSRKRVEDLRGTIGLLKEEGR